LLASVAPTYAPKCIMLAGFSHIARKQSRKAYSKDQVAEIELLRRYGRYATR
jgi:hypothetical protein